MARGDELIEVFPFCALTGTEVLLWNSASGKHIHYSTHSNGMPRKLRADTLDPFTLWECSRSGGSTVHFALLEDLDDLAVVAERRDEPVVSHDEFLAELKRDGTL